jgi:hypothetical protein
MRISQMIAIAVVAWSGTIVAQAQDPSALLAVQQVSRDASISKTTVTVKNMGTRAITAWGMVFSSKQYTQEMFYALGIQSGRPGMHAAGLGELLPGESMDVVLPAGLDSSPRVNAVILDDRTAAGDEAQIAAMFQYRAAYAAEWQRWSLVLSANATPGGAEQSEIMHMLESPARPRGDAATAAGLTAAHQAIELLLQGASTAATTGYLSERAAQLQFHSERFAASSTAAPPASTTAAARIALAISPASALRREPNGCRAPGQRFTIAAYSDVFEGSGTSMRKLDQLGAVASGTCAAPDAASVCSPAFLTSTGSSPASASITAVSLAYIPGVGCTFANSQTATMLSPTSDKTLFRALLDAAPICAEPPPSITYITFKNSLMSSFKRVNQSYKSVGSYSGKTIRFSFETDPAGATVPSSQIAWSGQASGSAMEVDVPFTSAGTFTVNVTVSGVTRSASIRVIDQPTGIGQDAYAALHPIDTATALYNNLIGTTTSTLEPFVWANAQYPGSQLNTIADAARHTYWNCALAVLVNPGYAEGITYEHEVSSPGPATETIMDLNNNAAGRAVAAGLPAANRNLVGCRAAVISAISSGSSTIYLDGSYTSSNTQEDALLQPTNR